MILIIGSKNASSWSLRPWLALKMAKLPFTEVVIALNKPDTKQQILQHSASGKVPILKAGEEIIWESLAICEYVAELVPNMWLKDPMERALARSICCEMHAGFTALRKNLPMDIHWTSSSERLCTRCSERYSTYPTNLERLPGAFKRRFFVW
jgi:glutathione S-transferase